VSWGSFEAVVLRSPWDYSRREREFRDWLDALEEAGARVLNPVPVVRENLDKTYLRALEARGVATPPSLWIARGDPRSGRELLADVRWREIVVKPTFSAGAFRTRKTTTDALRSDDSPLREVLGDAGALVQPFLREVVEKGEWSFVWFGDRYSHAVLKRPKPGDFRVQFVHGGTHVEATAPPALMRQAAHAVSLLGGGCLYTRLDAVEIDGRLVVMEVERTEPYLFLGESPGAPQRFVDALVGLLGRA
jgi:glutathione synthase/RimK-type ligase-like ATP-grasp enzyme